MSKLSKLLGVLLAAGALALAGPVQAQETNAQAQVKRSAEQPGNNAPVWRDVKSGAKNYTTLPKHQGAVLIQSQLRFPGQKSFSTAGEAWRNFRNGPLTFYGGWLVIIAAAVILLYYAIRGMWKLKEPLTGRLVERFNSLERIAHWCAAISFAFSMILSEA